MLLCYLPRVGLWSLSNWRRRLWVKVNLCMHKKKTNKQKKKSIRLYDLDIHINIETVLYSLFRAMAAGFSFLNRIQATQFPSVFASCELCVKIPGLKFAPFFSCRRLFWRHVGSMCTISLLHLHSPFYSEKIIQLEIPLNQQSTKSYEYPKVVLRGNKYSEKTDEIDVTY